MYSLRIRLFVYVVGGLVVSLFGSSCPAQFLDYGFEGVITEVIENENGVIPSLTVGDTFDGQLRFNSQGWNGTAGIIAVYLNGVELRFEGDSIYGGLDLEPFYSLRMVADQAGAGADIRDSTFSASNFGVTLEDRDPSDLYNETYPVFLDPEEYEKNEFNIFGSVISSMDRVNAVGELTSLNQVVVDCFGDTDGDFDTDIDDIDGFADVLGESALFHQCFEFNGDGVITLDDHDELITTWVNVLPDLNGTFIGDLNLDGSVDVLNDAFTLVSNLGNSGDVGYADGDLNADRRVDVLADGFRLVENLGNSIGVTSRPAAASVPEPGVSLLWIAVALFSLRKRQRG